MNSTSPDSASPEFPQPTDPAWLEIVLAQAGSPAGEEVHPPPLPPMDEGYRALAAVTPDAVLIVDAALRVASVNATCLQLFGVPEGTLLTGRSSLLLLDEHERARAAHLVSRFLETGIWDIAELMARHVDGSAFPVELHCEMLRDPRGRFAGMLVLVRDLRARHEAEDPLRSIVERTSRATGRAFFESLVQHLAEVLSVHLAIVAELTGPASGAARALAVWSSDGLAENFTYDLAGTPCEQVSTGKVCYFPEGVQELFPTDEWLREVGAEGYLGAPLTDSSGAVIGLLEVLDSAPMYRSRDVTSILGVFATRAAAELERTRIEAALATSEERLAAAVRGSRDGLFDANLTTLEIYCSPRLYAITGYAGHEAEMDLSLEGLRARLHPDDAEATRAILIQCVAEGKPYHHSFRWRTRAGEYRWCEARLDTRCDADNNPVRLSGFVTDVTDLRREARLAGETGRLVMIGGWEYDLVAERLHWTEGTFQLHGVTSSTYQPTVETAIDFYAPESRPQIRSLVERAMATGESWDQVLQLDPAGGSRLWVRVLGRAEWDRGRVVRLFGAIQDVSAQRALEQELVQSQKLEGIGRLAGGIAHDFNNMLTAILGYADLGLAGLPAESPVREDLEQIRRAGTSAAELTSQLLAFARRQRISPRAVDLHSLLEEVLPLLRSLAGAGVTVQVDMPPDVWPVTVDPGPLEQVLVNLVINARDAMPDGGAITISAANLSPGDAPGPPGQELHSIDWVELLVMDTGSGIAADVLPLIFDPFFTTKPRGKGTGLGLATCHGLIHQAGGHIRATSALGAGTTIHCLLPRSTVPAAIPEGGGEPPARLGTETILLLEDEPPVRALTARILRAQGYLVLEAASGAEAVVLAERHGKPLDLIVTDVVMPQMSGPEVVQTLRRHQPDLRALLMSGYADQGLVGADVLPPNTEFLPKPFSPANLASRVRDLLDTPPA